MALLPGYIERKTMRRTAEGLDQLGQDEITERNARRFDASPAVSSGESTRYSSPEEPGPRKPDQFEEVYLLVQARRRGTPAAMFEFETQQQQERLMQQMTQSLHGRKITLAFDKDLVLWKNAENNVRELWVEQGIWSDAWGPAWPSQSQPKASGQTKSLFDVNFRESPKPQGTWNHEYPAKDSLALRESIGPDGTLGIDGSGASRPLYQFLRHVKRERDWLQNEYEWKGGMETVNLDEMSYANTLQAWRAHGLWRSSWGCFPGLKWAHEERDEALENNDIYRQHFAGSAKPNALRPEVDRWPARPISPDLRSTDASAQNGRQECAQPEQKQKSKSTAKANFRFGKAPPPQEAASNGGNSGTEVIATNSAKRKRSQEVEDQNPSEGKRRAILPVSQSGKTRPEVGFESLAAKFPNGLFGRHMLPGVSPEAPSAHSTPRDTLSSNRSPPPRSDLPSPSPSAVLRRSQRLRGR